MYTFLLLFCVYAWDGNYGGKWRIAYVCRIRKSSSEQGKLCTASVKACTTNNDDLNGARVRSCAYSASHSLYMENVWQQ